MPDFTISEIEQADWPQILAVYNEGIETGIAASVASPRQRFRGGQLEPVRFILTLKRA